jgi:predicted nucleotidyltransferase component of viral defense system
MKRIDFVNELSTRLEIKRRDLIEKDVILHFILLNLSKDKFFSENFAFKGGTCLIKCFYGYIRFSEDIDFTWRNQADFDGKSQKKVREMLSKRIDKTGNVFQKIARKLDLEFKNDKGNNKYFEIGGSDKSCTLKIWYQSEVLKKESFLKVQINFVEHLCFPFKDRSAKSLFAKRDEELDSLFPEFSEYSTPAKISTYDIKEILAEKVRAMLTRRGTKARDSIDIYLIHKNFGLDPADVEACISKKMELALGLYERFRKNLREKIKLLDSDDFFDWGEERELLIKEINEKEFYLYLQELRAFLKKFVRSLEENK